jgi:hypothetical protein
MNLQLVAEGSYNIPDEGSYSVPAEGSYSIPAEGSYNIPAEISYSNAFFAVNWLSTILLAEKSQN